MSRPEASDEHANLTRTVLTRQADALRKAGQRVHNAPDRDKVAVIVEPRDHPLLEPCIRNVMHFLGDGWNLQVFTGPYGRERLDLAFPDWDFRVTDLGLVNMSAHEHNKLLRTKAFWRAIPEEHVLIFQTDAFMFRGGMDSFLEWDMIGAKILNPHEQTPDKRGYNGGMSLRRRSSMLEALQRVSVGDVEAYREKRGVNRLPSLALTGKVAEDVYYFHALEMLGKRLPDDETAGRFSTEAVYNPESVCIHAACVKRFFDLELLLAMFRRSELAQYL